MAQRERWADAESGAELCELGMHAFFGAGENAGKEQGYRLFLRAAWQGNADGMALAACCLLYGQGTSQDRRAAADWFFRAHGAGSAAAGYALLSCFYADGFEDVARFREAHPEKSPEELREGEKRGEIADMVALGYAYLYGYGVRRDLRCAHRLLLRAADAHDPKALFGLYTLLTNPDVKGGFPGTPLRPAALLRRSAAMGFPPAFRRLSEAAALSHALLDAVEEFSSELSPAELERLLTDDD